MKELMTLKTICGSRIPTVFTSQNHKPLQLNNLENRNLKNILTTVEDGLN
jgi:hypothetical protein